MKLHKCSFCHELKRGRPGTHVMIVSHVCKFRIKPPDRFTKLDQFMLYHGAVEQIVLSDKSYDWNTLDQKLMSEQVSNLENYLDTL